MFNWVLQDCVNILEAEGIVRRGKAVTKYGEPVIKQRKGARLFCGDVTLSVPMTRKTSTDTTLRLDWNPYTETATLWERVGDGSTDGTVWLRRAGGDSESIFHVSVITYTVLYPR